MKRDRAAYMREYRARKTAAHERYDEAKPLIGSLKTRIGELEAEVRHLKAELATRPAAIVPPSFNSQPFTPVPKVRR
jgi:uncharacterized small protein (DUF1192 family)